MNVKQLADIDAPKSIQGGVTVVQIREKDVDTREVCSLTPNLPFLTLPHSL